LIISQKCIIFGIYQTTSGNNLFPFIHSLKQLIMKKQLLLIAITVLFISSCSKSNNNNVAPSSETAVSASQSSQSKIAGKCGKALTGSLNYAFTDAFDLPCVYGSFTPVGNLYGTGTLTHLGLSSSKIKPCVSPIYLGTVQIGDSVGVECATLVAANGDQVFTHIRPYGLYFISATSASGILYADITGGTGRFAGATGGFSGVVTVFFSLGTATCAGITGTIDY
jgi:hypothetical protein